MAACQWLLVIGQYWTLVVVDRGVGLDATRRGAKWRFIDTPRRIISSRS